jgi:hypothetical protein
MRYFLTVKNYSNTPEAEPEQPEQGLAFFRGLINAFLLVIPIYMIIGVVIWMVAT